MRPFEVRDDAFHGRDVCVEVLNSDYDCSGKGRTVTWTDDKNTVIIRLMILFLTGKAGARPIISRSTSDSFSAPSNQVSKSVNASELGKQEYPYL